MNFILIPANILSEQSIPASAKLLLGLIISLQSSKGFCYASNAYLAEQLGVSPKRVSSMIAELEALKLITREIKLSDKNEVTERKISTNFEFDVALDPILKNKERVSPKTRGGSTQIQGEGIPINEDIIYKDNKKKKKDCSLRDSKFEEFWNEYGKKTGKIKAKELWDKLKEEEYDEVISATKVYVIQRPDAVYRKDPERFLKYRLFDDEALKVQVKSNNNPATSTEIFEAQIPDQWK